ncbi:heme utilization cystosolic carrier protein HutX [Veronia nyctiphanis]|uniref:Heme utilization cystosolic carrier protein HutX n=1 Tax=Veronia nyctiphanis TaxID=1278244 RepID=A0A4Q0YTG8_9GAMM|nr:heme utilization cystosolic carrier protein HutX [Veronia nyctiphanis]RXJ74527.1 heme utilization cystosolic carrier protein HutX [Veronia nyctiphanis]
MHAVDVALQTRQEVADYLSKDADTPVSMMAESLGRSEGQVTLALPDDMVKTVDGNHAQYVLEALPEWGKVTTIVHSFGSIFEAKATFPKGKVAHGFYNLMGKDGELHGHLRLENVQHVCFVSKPFRGMESHYIAFFTEGLECVFKIYLGRDKKRQLLEGQVEKFYALKKELTNE